MNTTYEIARLTAKYDAMIKVNVPATQGRKAYSYMREGGEIVEKIFSSLGKLATISSGSKTTEAKQKAGKRTQIKSTYLEPELKEVIGSGFFGTVYITNENTAFKKAGKRKYFNESEVDLARKAGEKGLAPKILKVVKDSKNNIIGYEMEFLKEHEPLRSILLRSTNDRDFMDKSFDEALKATFRLHKEGIVHGDLHQMNILQNNGDTKIIDFGMSTKLANKQNPTDIELTRWKRDLLYLQDTYKMRLGRTDKEDTGYKTPTQRTFREVLDLAQTDEKKAYEYYKKEIKKYV